MTTQSPLPALAAQLTDLRGALGRYGTRSGPEVPARGRVVGARHTTLRIPL